MRAQSRAGRPRKSAGRPSAREDLLDAAHALMSERVAIDVPLVDIAERAGLTVALVTYYFGTKDNLLLELALRHHARWEAQLQRLLDRPGSAAEKLSLHVGAMVRAFRRAPYLQRINHKFLRSGADNDDTRTLARALINPLASFYVKLVEQGVAEGVFRRVEPMHLYLMIIGACDMLFTAESSLKHGFGIEAVDDAAAAGFAETLQTTLLTGLRTTAPT